LVKVTNGDPRHSDHRPIIIDVGRRECMAWGEQVEVLPKFEARWLEEEDCETKVVETWRGAMEEGCDCIMAIPKKVLGVLKEWDKNVLGELEKRIKKVRRELEMWRRQGISQESVNRQHILRYKLERLQDQQNVYWKQRAHNTWLLKGDRNTGFFHAFASKRRRKNHVTKLMDDNGNFMAGEQLKNFITNQYQSLFMSHAYSSFDEVMNCVHPRVSLEMKPYSLQFLERKYGMLL